MAPRVELRPLSSEMHCPAYAATTPTHKLLTKPTAVKHTKDIFVVRRSQMNLRPSIGAQTLWPTTSG